jgi:hypothetical protein
MIPRILPLLAVVGFTVAVSAAAALPQASVVRTADRVRVELGGKLFTEYVYQGGPRPYFYPVLAEDGTRLNRDFPMKADTPGEELDHPHHRSLWFTHGAVNGVDFWTERKDAGTIINETVKATAAGSVATLVSTNRWVAADGWRGKLPTAAGAPLLSGSSHCRSERMRAVRLLLRQRFVDTNIYVTQ